MPSLKLWYAKTWSNIARYERTINGTGPLNEATKNPPELIQRKIDLAGLLGSLESDVNELLKDYERSKSKAVAGSLRAAFESDDLDKLKAGFEQLKELTKPEDGIEQTQRFAMIHYEPFPQASKQSPDPETIMNAVSTALFHVPGVYNAQKSELVSRAGALDQEAKEIAEALRTTKLKKIAIDHEPVVLKVGDCEKKLQEAGHLLNWYNGAVENAKAETKRYEKAYLSVAIERKPYRYAPASEQEAWRQELAAIEKQLDMVIEAQKQAEENLLLHRSQFTNAKWDLQEARQQFMLWEEIHDYFANYVAPPAPVGVRYTEAPLGRGFAA